MTSEVTRTRAARAERKSEPSTKKPPLRPDLTILQAQVFRGPNYWSYEPSIRLLVDLGSLEHWPSNTIRGFNAKLLKALPGVGEHSCSLGKRGGFRERLEDGTWLGHVAEHVALELQRESGAHISRGQDPERRSPRPLQRDLRLRRGDRRRRGGQDGRPAREPPDQGRPRLRLRRGARTADPARRATAVRALDPGDHRRGRHARYPVDAPERVLARPARPGQVPAADPGDDDVDDERPRGRHRRRQEDDEPTAGGRRVCPCRGARSCAPRMPRSPPRAGSGSPW